MYCNNLSGKYLAYSWPIIARTTRGSGLLRGYCSCNGPDNSVGIATGHGLDGPVIESRWERYFPHLSRPALGPTQPPLQRVTCLSRG